MRGNGGVWVCVRERERWRSGVGEIESVGERDRVCGGLRECAVRSIQSHRHPSNGLLRGHPRRRLMSLVLIYSYFVLLICVYHFSPINFYFVVSIASSFYCCFLFNHVLLQ